MLMGEIVLHNNRNQNQSLHLLLLALALIVCVFLALVVNVHYGIDVVYTHLFYIPIIMAGVWYHRGALLIAGGLGLVHISCDYVINHGLTSSSLLRMGMFLGIALIVGLLSEKRDLLYQELQKSNNVIKETEIIYKTVAGFTSDWETWEDETGQLKYISLACERTSGYTVNEFSENKTLFASLILEEDQERWANHRHDIEFDKGLHSEQFRIRNKNGKIVWIEHICRPVIDKNGMFLGYRANNRDITDRKQAETKLQEANQKMGVWVSELEERTADMSQLIEMGEQLQICQTVEEACAISAQYIQKICPSSQGALYLISPSKDLAEAVNMWGDSPSTEKVFMPLNCWAVRSGRPHLVDGSHPGLLCGHITGPSDGQYLCVPMMDHDEAIGILHLNHTAPEQEQQKSTGKMCSEHKTQLALAVADHIALALSNLRMRETLHQQAIRDMLTGLFNRRYMEESLARELSRAEREKKPVGVIMFDIDHFKDFNDLFGHAGGDALLRKLGAFLNNHTRRGDIVSRYGGEEFVYVLPGASLEETRLRAEDLRQGVTELRVFHLGEPLGKITISFGVAVFPEHGLTSEAILKSADTALYRAKNEGRDRVVVASTIG